MNYSGTQEVLKTYFSITKGLLDFLNTTATALDMHNSDYDPALLCRVPF